MAKGIQTPIRPTQQHTRTRKSVRMSVCVRAQCSSAAVLDLRRFRFQIAGRRGTVPVYVYTLLTNIHTTLKM